MPETTTNTEAPDQANPQAEAPTPQSDADALRRRIEELEKTVKELSRLKDRTTEEETIAGKIRDDNTELGEIDGEMEALKKRRKGVEERKERRLGELLEKTVKELSRLKDRTTEEETIAGKIRDDNTELGEIDGEMEALKKRRKGVEERKERRLGELLDVIRGQGNLFSARNEPKSPASDEAWRSTPVNVAMPLTEKQTQLLLDGGISTMGEYLDYSNAHHGLQGIKGIKSELEGKLADWAADWHIKNGRGDTGKAPAAKATKPADNPPAAPTCKEPLHVEPVWPQDLGLTWRVIDDARIPSIANTLALKVEPEVPAVMAHDGQLFIVSQVRSECGDGYDLIPVDDVGPDDVGPDDAETPAEDGIVGRIVMARTSKKGEAARCIITGRQDWLICRKGDKPAAPSIPDTTAAMRDRLAEIERGITAMGKLSDDTTVKRCENLQEERDAITAKLAEIQERDSALASGLAEPHMSIRAFEWSDGQWSADGETSLSADGGAWMVDFGPAHPTRAAAVLERLRECAKWAKQREKDKGLGKADKKLAKTLGERLASEIERFTKGEDTASDASDAPAIITAAELGIDPAELADSDSGEAIRVSGTVVQVFTHNDTRYVNVGPLEGHANVWQLRPLYPQDQWEKLPEERTALVQGDLGGEVIDYEDAAYVVGTAADGLCVSADPVAEQVA